MLKGFKEFLLRGNIVELATAVIIGTAFTAIVTEFTKYIISPLLAAIPTGGSDCGQTMPAGEDGATQQATVQVCGLQYQIRKGDPSTILNFGDVIAAGINFIIIAAVVYFLIVVPYNKFEELAKLNKDEDDEDEKDILNDIRDLLKGDSDETAKAGDAGVNPVLAAATAGQVAAGAAASPPPVTQAYSAPEAYSAPPAAPAAPAAPTPPAAPQGYSYQPAPTPPPQAPAEYPAAPADYQAPAAPADYRMPPANPGDYLPPAPGDYPPAPGDYPPGGEHPRHSR
ncbi:MAG: MscL family protein [Gordonia sp. (in: high G+C Gram-positive bacteria)]|uniref:large conductance mechanosensitive channel protein MscL n=1 Tax=Gordonia sp. (in: high G+C Gram-positive bacteria) TaxID=84139 RepID=UPI0039E4E5DA